MDEPQLTPPCFMDETSMENSPNNNADNLKSDETQDVKMVAKEHLMEVVKWWNLPTRCRLRRVSNVWNEIISMPEVNTTVFINPSCLTVSEIEHRASPPPRRIHLPCMHPRAQDRPDLQLARKTVNQPPRFIAWARRHFHSQLQSDCRLTDYQRGGLMGPHVRVLIYEEAPADQRVNMMQCGCGCASPLSQHDYCFILRTIGSHCPNVQKIVLRGARFSFGSWGVPDIAVKSHWISQPPVLTGFPWLVSVTLLSSSLACCDMVTPVKHRSLCYTVTIPFLMLEWRPEDDSTVMDLSGFIWTDVTAQREWVAKHAKDLPENCREFISGVNMKNLNWMMKGEELNPDMTYDVDTMDYASAPLAIILLLAAFIQHQLPAAAADQPTRHESDVEIRWGGR